MNHIPTILGIIVVLAVLGSVAGWLEVSAAKKILSRWAEMNGYEIVSKEFRVMRVGPFWLKTRHQQVYYVTVRTPEGQIRKGWVCCGGPLFGNGATVRWDE
jgi:hypothetical protein